MRAPTHCWLLVLYADHDHSEIARFWVLPSIKACAELVGEGSQTVSNWYHGLIRARNALQYCRLARLKHNPFKQFASRPAGRRRRAVGAFHGRQVCGGASRRLGGVSRSHNVYEPS